jgi:hypothetical protein
MAHAAAQVEVEDTWLDPRDSVDGVNLQYTVEMGRDDDHGTTDRRRAAGEPGPAPPGDEGAPVARRDRDRGGEVVQQSAIAPALV